MSSPKPSESEIIEGQPEAPRPHRRWHIDHLRGALNSFDDAPLEHTEVNIESHPIEDASADVPADSGGDDG